MAEYLGRLYGLFDKPVTRLRWPRHLLASELAGQLERDDITDEDVEVWSARNRELLREAFTTTEVLYEYDPWAEVRENPTNWVEFTDEGGERRLAPLFKGGITLFGHEPKPMPIFSASVAAPMPHGREELRRGSERLRVIADRLELYEEVVPDLNEEAVVAAGGSYVFLVHGRDDGTKETVARALRQLTGDEPVILHEQVDRGETIIEKFERHAGAAEAAVVILTPDDVGGIAGSDVLRPRARQNVVYELGWFHGKLGRGRVIALLVDDVEQPSDVLGVIYIPVDQAGAWRYKLGHRLRDIGLDVDLDNVRY